MRDAMIANAAPFGAGKVIKVDCVAYAGHDREERD